MPIAAGMYYNLSQLGSPSLPPLILIHGAGGSCLGWHTRIRRMRGITVYALDLPGHGKSVGEGRHSIQGYAQDVINFMQTAGIYQGILAGHSMGGMVALDLAYQYSERVAGLVMVNSAAYCSIPEWIPNGLLNPLTYAQSMEWLVSSLAGGSGADRWVEATRRAIEQTRKGVLYGDLHACRSSELSGLAARINQPCLICYGTLDRFFPPKSSRMLAHQIPNARSLEVEDCGHLLPLEKPDVLVEAIRHEFYPTIE
jgi:pimeloyl-ACP methyl ester carboxylesterase